MFKTIIHHPHSKMAAVIAILAVIAGSVMLSLAHKQIVFDTVSPEIRDITETVLESGQVSADSDAVLSFDKTGRVVSVSVGIGNRVSKGQTLASLDASDLYASLSGAQADVSGAQAKLAELVKGARPEELTLYEQKHSDASDALVTAMNNAYLQAENAVVSKADVVFVNGSSPNPQIVFHVDSEEKRLLVNNDRILAAEALASAKTSLGSLASLEEKHTLVQSNLQSIKEFIDELGNLTSVLTVGNSGASQSQIDSYRSNINAAGVQVAAALSSELGAYASYAGARDSLTLEKAGSSAEAIQVQEAVVAKLQSVVQGYQSQIAHTKITSPIDGIITLAEPKVGEVYAAGTPAFRVESGSGFKIDLFLPETEIGEVTQGDPATITLDAVRNRVFKGIVSTISGAPSGLDGSMGYKVTVRFAEADQRLKSGLGANVSIEVGKVSGVIAVPETSIIIKGPDSFVLAKDGTSFVNRKVSTGAKGEGFVEIKDGLGVADSIAAFGK